MSRAIQAPRAAMGIAAVGAASALAGVLLLAAPAAVAAEGEIVGSATVVLDFSVAGEVDVEVTTQNLSDVSAYGAASVIAPDGARYDFGPKLYTPDQVWVYTKVLTGYTCADLELVSAAAFGFADLSDSTPEWTTGVVTYPDERVTVIGCDVPASPTPTETTTSPLPSTSAAVVSGNQLPPSMTDGALVAPGSSTGALGATFLIAAAGLAAAAAGLFVRGRRLHPTPAE